MNATATFQEEKMLALEYHRKAHLLLHDAAQEAISEIRYGSTDAAVHILLRAGVADPDGPTEYEPDRSDED